MTRLIKRYGSRKLYDTQESRYISLEEIAEWVRSGEDIKVIDNGSSEDVTALTLTQVISEEGRKKSQFLSSDLLHDLIRTGETMVSSRVKLFQDGVEGFVKKSLNRFVPVSNVRDEMNHLRNRLEELEQTLAETETEQILPPEPEVATKTVAKTNSVKKPRTRKTPASTAVRTRRTKKAAETGTTTTENKKSSKDNKEEVAG